MKKRAFTLIELIISIMVFCFVVILLLAFWTDRSIEYWQIVADKAPDCPYWVAFVASILVPVALLGNVITEVARLFI